MLCVHLLNVLSLTLLTMEKAGEGATGARRMSHTGLLRQKENTTGPKHTDHLISPSLQAL